MPQLTFFDLKTKKKFTTDKFKLVTKSGRNFAVATAPSGVQSYRIVSRDFMKENK